MGRASVLVGRASVLVGRASVQWGGPLCPPKEVIPEARLRRAIRDPDKDNPVSVWFLVFITASCPLPAVFPYALCSMPYAYLHREYLGLVLLV